MTLASLEDWRALSDDYARYHTHPMNRLTHAFGIPLIVLSVVGWTQPSGALVPWAALVLPLYFIWNVPLALGMSALILGMAAAARGLPGWSLWATFIVGWILQFIGHAVFEGKSPAFSKNIIHLLVGPMWILQEFSPARAGK